MNDRELLELAAKAAGDDVRRELMDNGEPFFIGQSIEHAWNPLIYDGDALRLAVDLKISIKFFGEHQSIASVGKDGSVKFNGMPRDGDFYERTRRAIVRAAAEIGRRM